MRTFTLLFIALAMGLPGIAQKMCGTEAYQERIRKEFPSSLKDFGINISPSVTGSGSSSGLSSQQIITIPVVVHVLYTNDGNNISDKLIQDQIDILNRDFNLGSDDIFRIPSAFKSRSGVANIRFQLARVDPTGKATTGITRKKSAREFWANDDKVKDPAFGGVKAWDHKAYLNIWVCNLVPGLLGYSSAPGSPADKDGVVIKSNVFGGGSGSFSKGRTAVHEVGHWLNLKHLWGDRECGSDEVDDTPAQRTFNQGCPGFPKLNTSCSDGNAAGEMFMNFMDFTDDACMMMFTEGQVNRMRSLFAEGGARASMLSSKALGTPWNNSDNGVIVSAPNTSPGSTAPQFSMAIYPNPASGSISINSKGVAIAGTRYQLFSIQGRLLMEGSFTSEQMRINVSSLKPGLYFVKLLGSGQALRFIKH